VWLEPYVSIDVGTKAPGFDSTSEWCVYTKIVTSLGVNQSSKAHLKKDVGSKIERQRGGHPKLLTNLEKRHCVILVTEN